MVGSQGALAVDAFGQRLSLYGPDGLRWVDWGSDPNQAMLGHFIETIGRREAPSVTGMDGLVATEVALAAYESVRTGRPVPIGTRGVS